MTVKWEQRMPETDRGLFEVFVTGTGRPICVTHDYSAFTARGNYFADRFTSLGQVILVNLRGCGNSVGIEDEHELDKAETVNDLEAIRTKLGFGTWTFAGHSTGGILGLIYAIEYPHALDALLVVGAAASNRYMAMRDSMYCKDNPNNARLLAHFATLRSAHASVEEKGKAAREWTELSLHHPEKWDDYFRQPSSGRTVQQRLDGYNKRLPAFDVEAALPSILTPTLILCGKYDAQCPLACSEEMHRRIPGSQLGIFEDSNHCPHLEQPEQFTDVARRFLERHHTL